MKTDFSGLDVRQLVAFVGVVDSGTFAKAADRLGYTQGAISQQIAALERMVGAPLFDRPGGPRPATLTPLGSFLADRARDLLNRIHALAEEADRVRDGRAGVLGIASFQSVTAEVLPTVLARMRQRYPDLEFRITAGDSDDELVAAIESGRADVAFVAQPAPQVTAEAVLADPWVVMARPGDLPSGPIEPSRLDGVAMIGPDADTWQRQSETELAAMGAQPNFTLRTADNATAAAMVRAGIGSALMPLLATIDHASGLETHPFEPPLTDRQIFLARPIGRTVPPSVESFVDITRSVCSELAAAMGLRPPSS